MATSHLPGVLRKEHRYMFLLMHTVDQEGPHMIKTIYTHGTRTRDPTESLVDRILRLNGMTTDEFEHKFNSVVRNKIASDPSMESFDITIWYLVLQYGCDRLARPDDDAWLTSGTLENYLKLIKDFRNEAIHSGFSLSETEFYHKLEELRKLLVRTALVAKSKFSLDHITVNEFITRFHANINNVRDKQVNNVHFLSSDTSPYINFLKSKGTPELMDFFQGFAHVNPAALIAGQDIPMDVRDIFTPLIIHGEGEKNTNNCGGDENTNRPTIGEEENTYQTVCLDDIFEVAHTKAKDIIILEGIAGVGKTTIIKKILSDWTGSSTVKRLKMYDFIVLVQCRDRFYNSLGRLVSALMPEARKKFHEDMHMMHCLFGCKTLFILDGIDETTPESNCILTELLRMIEGENFSILLTTRPEKIKEIYQKISSVHERVLHLNIEGVAEINKEEFIAKYFAKLSDLGIASQENANCLLSYLQTTGVRLQDHWRLPLNLTLVSLLWGINDDRTRSITCPTELMNGIQKISLVKLEERVVNRIEYPLQVFDTKIAGFMSLLYEIALFGIRRSELLIPQNEIKKIFEMCATSELPTQELLGSFLVKNISWSSDDLYSFPNKSSQELHAAMHIHNQVFDNKDKLKTEEKLKSIYNFLSRKNTPSVILQGVTKLIKKEKAKAKTVSDVLLQISRGDTTPLPKSTYQGTLTSLLGVLHYRKTLVADESTDDLIRLLKDTGVRRRNDWIALLNKVKCNPMVTKILIKTVPNILKGIVEISDVDVFAYATLLKYKLPMKLMIQIKGKPSNIPRTDELFENMACGNIFVDCLTLEHLFRHPGTDYRSMYSVQAVLRNCRVENYMGQVPSEGDLLNGIGSEEGMGYLWVSLASEGDVDALFSHLRWREEHQQPLWCLVINLGDLISAKKFQSIPIGSVDTDDGYIYIFLPNVEEKEKEEEGGGGGGEGGSGGGRVTEDDRRRHRSVKDILWILNPSDKRGFTSLCFPRYKGTPSPQERNQGGEEGSIRNLLQNLQGLKVEDGIYFPSRCCHFEDSSSDEYLQEDCKRILQCYRGIKWGSGPNWKGSIWDMDTWE